MLSQLPGKNFFKSPLFPAKKKISTVVQLYFVLDSSSLVPAGPKIKN